MSACLSGGKQNDSKAKLALFKFLGYIRLLIRMPGYSSLGHAAALQGLGTLSLAVAYQQFCTTHQVRQCPLSALRFVYGSQAH